MTVQTLNWNGASGSSPGPNSCCITYDINDMIYDTTTAQNFPVGYVSTAVHNFLTTHGWEFINCSPALTIGKYAYKAPNLLDSVGASSEKFFILDFTTSGKCYLNVYESIATNGTLTNLSAQSNFAHMSVAFNTSGSANTSGKFWISATARHAAFHSFNTLTYGNTVAVTTVLQGDFGPVIIAETTRSQYDLVSNGYLKHGFITTGFFSGNTNPFYPIAMPRNRVGTTTNAQCGFITKYGCVGMFNGSGVQGQLMPLYNNFTTNRVHCSNIHVRESGGSLLSTDIIGNVINIFALQRSIGNIIGDDIQLPVSVHPVYGEKFIDENSDTYESYWIIGGIGGLNIRLAVLK